MSTSYHHGDLYNALLSQAIELIESGKDPSLRAIATAVGVSPTATYRHFKNKQELTDAIAGFGFAELNKAQSQVHTLAEMGLAYLRFAHSHPGLFNAMFTSDCNPNSPTRYSAVVALKNNFHDRLIDILGHEPTDCEALAIWSTIHGFTVLSLEEKLHTDSPETLLPQVLSHLKV